MSDKEKKLDLLNQFDKKESLYDDFLKYFYHTITSILKGHSIVVQNVDTRLKKRDSLDKKIKLKKKYKNLEDITDVCGMRIITYFSDDVDKIADIIKKEFKIDEKNSVDKRKIDDPTKFGYVSLHYIISLKGARANLPEAKRFKNLKIEIQIRTILQHAWAEIEHDLGYKTVGDIPDSIRRKFSLLAGQIELVDENFVMIKNAMEEYSEEVIYKMENNENRIPIDVVSVSAFVNNDDEYLQSIELLSQETNAHIDINVDADDYKKYLSTIVDRCNVLEIRTISQLKEIYMRYISGIVIAYKELGIIGFANTSPLSEVLFTLVAKNSLDMSQEDFIDQVIFEFEQSIKAQQDMEFDSFMKEKGTLEWDEEDE